MQLSHFLERLGVAQPTRSTSALDPGYSPLEFDSHLAQSGHLLSTVKLSMACWMIANEASTRAKTATARQLGVTTVTGGGPYEVAATQGVFLEYLDLCADIGVDRIEAGDGFTDVDLRPDDVVRAAADRGLEVQFELGKKHGGRFDDDGVSALIEQGRAWLGAGARQLVIEARESARAVGLFDMDGRFNADLSERFVDAFGMGVVVFEAPTKPAQFALLDHFGPEVQLANVRFEEILRVEIYRRGLHSDAFRNPKLRPQVPTASR